MAAPDSPQRTRRRRAGRPPVLRRVLLAWALALLLPLGAAVGFIMATDPAGYFRLNAFGTYGGDELFLKSSLMRHRPYDALLLGDSRAAYTDPQEVPGLTFLNAGAGGAGVRKVEALLRRSDLQGVKLVVLMAPLGDILDDCGRDEPSPWGLETALRQGATFDALGAAIDHLRRRLRGDLPDHRFDGTRYPAANVLTPYHWDGKRSERYRRRVAAAGEDGPLDAALAETTACTATLQGMRRHAEAAGAEFLLILAPLNRDLMTASGTDPARLDRLIAERVLRDLPFAVDFTVSRFSDPGNFPPADAIHFKPEVGGEVLAAGIARFCAAKGGCPW
jgi:hypothetical protein